MADWFKDWFNSPEYLEVYKHRNDEDAEKLVNLIISLTGIKEKDSVLDMACGSGRHAILFGRKGYNVTAVDLSENLLEIGRQKSFGLPIEFYHSDIRDFRPTKSYDLVVNLFTSFGYFNSDSENFGLFDLAYSCLKENGYFVFDFMNSEYVENNLEPESTSKTENAVIKQKRAILNGRVEKEITIDYGNEIKKFEESVKLFDVEELRSEITKRGFKILGLYGDYDGTEFIKTFSKRVIIISSK